MKNKIIIKGAREHNLKNINLELPKNKLIVITGVSGSGKSSLAFDTIYAEGQRRYVESLSSYARQFLGIMNKPDVELIEGLSPAISIDQKSTSHNPRSTVGTITEIYDYLRLLFARIGHPHCPKCKVEITKLSLDEIVIKIVNQIIKTVNENKIKPHKFTLYSPVIRQKKGEFKDLIKNIRSKGFMNIRIDGELKDIDSEFNILKNNKHNIDVETDSISVQYKDIKDNIFLSNLKTRLTTSVEQSLNLSDGLVVLKGKNEVLYSEHFSCPICNLSLPEIEPRMFSFNSPLGACIRCKGIGSIYRIDAELLLNKNLSINEGGILPFNRLYSQDTWFIRLLKTVARDENIDLNMPLKDFSSEKIDILLYGTKKTYEVYGKNKYGRMTKIFEQFLGIVNVLEMRFFEAGKDIESFEINKYIKEEICPECHGKRLKPEVLSITIDNKNICYISDKSILELINYFNNDVNNKINEYEKHISKHILKEIIVRLNFLSNVGLSYLTISRTAKTLSGGELQRIRLASQIGTGLTGVLYVLDEPSIGLHPKDVSALIKTLINLKDMGNTVIIVEHDRETIENADFTVELGPKAGNDGGKVIFTGSVKEMKKSKNSLTGKYLSKKKIVPINTNKLNRNKGQIELSGAKQYNLKNINIKLPLGNLIAVTGVSGSGKSSLIVETLYPALKYYINGFYNKNIGEFSKLLGYHYLERVYMVDQSPIGRTPRSNPATYTGFFDYIRDVFAETTESKAKGFKKGRFSFNVKGGRCEKCQGGGVIKIMMQFLPDIYVKCDVCQGNRYNNETLEIKYKGKTIFDILSMTIDEASNFFKNHFKIYQKTKFLQDVGLGYIKLGQPAPTFSGGEAQRIKLANELSKRDTGKTLYILDEPTTGLHFYDIEKLLSTLYKLVEKGNTVIIIEHNLDVIKNCQYIIDLGPGAGDKGGSVVYKGETLKILNNKSSYTAKYLKKHIK